MAEISKRFSENSVLNGTLRMRPREGDMSFPSQHLGSVKKRTWFKVRWMRNPPGLTVEGGYDLLMEADVQKYGDFVEIVKEIKTAECTRGLRIGFGKKEKEVDEWIEKNAE